MLTPQGLGTKRQSSDTKRRILGHIERLAADDYELSRDAEKRLIRFGEKAVDDLISAASSTDPKVRYSSVWTLGKIGDPRAMPTIVRLMDDPDERVRYDAVLALGELGYPGAVPFLVDRARHAQIGDPLAGAAVNALAKLSKAGIGGLRRILQEGTPYASELATNTLVMIAGESN